MYFWEKNKYLLKKTTDLSRDSTAQQILKTQYNLFIMFFNPYSARDIDEALLKITKNRRLGKV